MDHLLPENEGHVYDKAKHHFLGNFPQILPIEQAYVHIGMYMGWVINQELYSEFFEDEASTEIIRFTRRELPCTILSEIWDGYLGNDLFNEEGNEFTRSYYQSGQYLEDYQEVLAKDLPSVYHVSDTWENFDRLSVRLNERLTEWRANR